jgi:sialidase-1
MLEKETDDSKRCGLAREIVRAGDKSKIKILSRILADPNSNGRGHATESLYKIEKLGNLDLLVKCAGDDEHRKVQMWSCAALVRAGHKEFLPVLRRFVSSNDPLENSLSTYILGQLGEIRQKELVKERLKEQPKSLYSFFYTAGLVYMKDECALQQLPEFFESKDETIRSLAINTAGTVNPYRFKQKAINMLKDSADNVRIRAAHALINMK